MIKVLPLEGYNSLRALNVFHTLMLGLKMLPSYCGETYEDFYSKVETMPPEDQEKIIREAVLFVELEKPEVEAIVQFATDPNGISYKPENLKSLKPEMIFEIIVAVCIEISKIKIQFVSPAEKKNLKIAQ